MDSAAIYSWKTQAGSLALAILVLLSPGCATARERGDQAFMRQDWDSAAYDYHRAIGEAQNPQEVDYIQRRLSEARARAAASHLDSAKRHAAVGDTRQAAIHAEKAVEFGGSSEAQALFASLRASEGARFLSDGRAAHGSGRWNDAVVALTKAQEWAPSAEGANLLADSQAQLRNLEPATYRITLHSASVLPFKPEDQRPWDGFGGAVQGGDAMIGSLVKIASDPTGISSLIAGSRILSDATAKPDCYVLVVVAGQPITVARQTTQPDSLQPVWAVPFVVEGANYQDQRVVSITVVDQDIEQDDTVGNFQMTVGDLVRQPTQEISMVATDGSLRAGGILVVKVSAEKL